MLDGRFTSGPYAVSIMLTRLLDWITGILRQRQAHNELRRLDDRMLRDIGLDRGQLGAHFGRL